MSKLRRSGDASTSGSLRWPSALPSYLRVVRPETDQWDLRVVRPEKGAKPHPRANPPLISPLSATTSALAILVSAVAVHEFDDENAGNRGELLCQTREHSSQGPPVTLVAPPLHANGADRAEATYISDVSRPTPALAAVATRSLERTKGTHGNPRHALAGGQAASAGGPRACGGGGSDGGSPT